MDNYKWNNGVKKVDFTTNTIRNYVKNVFFDVLKKKGFYEVDLPTLDYADAFIVNNEYYSSQNHYKTVAPNGEILSIGDDVVKGLITLSTKAMTKKGKICASYDSYSFLSQAKERSNEFQAGGIIFGASGIEEEADCIVAALDFVKKMGVIKPKTEVGNTEAFLGVLSRFSGKDEKLDRLKAIVAGKIENDVDYATSQTLNELKNAEGGTSIIKELATKMDNQRSIDGLLDIFETLNVLEAYSITDGIKVKIGYLGGSTYDNGLVFSVKDESGRELIYGGRCDCMKGSDKIPCLYLKVRMDNAVEKVKAKGIFTEAENKRVTVAVAPTRSAIAKAFIVREDLNKEGFVTDVAYNMTEKEFIALAEDNKERVILFIDEDGDIKHS